MGYLKKADAKKFVKNALQEMVSQSVKFENVQKHLDKEQVYTIDKGTMEQLLKDVIDGKKQHLLTDGEPMVVADEAEDDLIEREKMNNLVD